jgi:uncharacterized OB-fold protein
MPYDKPRPRMDGIGAPYWQAAQRHELVAQRCGQCATFMFPPTTICEHCLSGDLVWTPLSGKGTVWSFIVMYQQYYSSFAADIPYNIAVVRSAEGPKFITNLVGIANDDVRVEMPVEVVFDDVDEGLTLPKWRAAI